MGNIASELKIYSHFHSVFTNHIFVKFKNTRRRTTAFLQTVFIFGFGNLTVGINSEYSIGYIFKDESDFGPTFLSLKKYIKLKNQFISEHYIVYIDRAY